MSTAVDDDAPRLPGLPSVSRLVRAVQTPEFAGLTFHEVLAESALNLSAAAECRRWDVGSRSEPTMSKLDAQRAMREARYAARNSSGQTRREAAGATAAPTPAQPEANPRKSTRAPTAQSEPAEAGDSAALCGHTSMNGRACTRPAGHAEKSHRYS